ncbi:MAG: hypothetical protein IPI21_15495 [Propionivibrio sp.]|nr:hypothetical protein [Propionivibrio sp.]
MVFGKPTAQRLPRRPALIPAFLHLDWYSRSVSGYLLTRRLVPAGGKFMVVKNRHAISRTTHRLRTLADHAALTFVTCVNAQQLTERAFCGATRTAERRMVAPWGSDERDRDSQTGYAPYVAFDLAEGLCCSTCQCPGEVFQFLDLSPPFQSPTSCSVHCMT